MTERGNECSARTAAPARLPVFSGGRESRTSPGMKRLSEAQCAAFRENGYLAPLDALSSDEAADYQRRLTASLGPTRHASPGLRNKPHLLLRWVADLVRDPRVLDAVEDLLGPDLLILRSVFFVKPPGDRSSVAWHQDVAYWDLSADRAVSAWIALTDSTVGNGCVRVVPGSHREPLLEHRLAHDGNNRLVHGQAAAVAVPPEHVACLELRAGQMSLHDGRLLHGSPDNPSDELRAGLAVRFIPPDVRQRGLRPSATLVRGVDRFGYYDHEPWPRFDDDPVARAWHARALRRYAVQVVRQALRRPSAGQLSLIARMAARRDALHAMLTGLGVEGLEGVKGLGAHNPDPLTPCLRPCTGRR
jgi:Phytanoyl-CoA dioxygenase (PhyH)